MLMLLVALLPLTSCFLIIGPFAVGWLIQGLSHALDLLAQILPELGAHVVGRRGGLRVPPRSGRRRLRVIHTRDEVVTNTPSARHRRRYRMRRR